MTRALLFTLASTSILCLLGEMYGVCYMRTLFFAAFLPATALLLCITMFDRWRGERVLARAVLFGAIAGVFGALAYDIFRLPFVFANCWGLEFFSVPQMPLFKVFPRFGARILGEALEQGVPEGEAGFAWGAGYSVAAQLLGWLYHVSNGATFGIMFAMLYATAKREWKWTSTLFAATCMAVAIEIALLLSPYTEFFGIHPTATFVIVTLAAHIVFGLALGACLAWLYRRASVTRLG
ncbi:MAG: hypothetical protein EXS10_01700 [Phycisphaerales bacterium]|nr:hypothetical protein [Phycisphaerales bacterium]